MSRRRRGRASSVDTQSLCALDLMSGLAAVALLIAVTAMLFVNEPPKDTDERRFPTEPTALYIEVRWESGAPHDVDTWIRCVTHLRGGDRIETEVNYQQKNSGFLTLTHDDLGKPSELNLERVVSNSEIEEMPGNSKCMVNVHLYSLHNGHLPIDGKLIVIQDKDGPTEKLLTPTEGLSFSLALPGEERTLFEIAWDGLGEAVTDSVLMFPNVPTTCIATSTCEKI